MISTENIRSWKCTILKNLVSAENIRSWLRVYDLPQVYDLNKSKRSLAEDSRSFYKNMTLIADYVFQRHDRIVSKSQDPLLSSRSLVDLKLSVKRLLTFRKMIVNFQLKDRILSFQIVYLICESRYDPFLTLKVEFVLKDDLQLQIGCIGKQSLKKRFWTFFSFWF